MPYFRLKFFVNSFDYSKYCESFAALTQCNIFVTDWRSSKQVPAGWIYKYYQ